MKHELKSMQFTQVLHELTLSTNMISEAAKVEVHWGK